MGVTQEQLTALRTKFESSTEGRPEILRDGRTLVKRGTKECIQLTKGSRNQDVSVITPETVTGLQQSKKSSVTSVHMGGVATISFNASAQQVVEFFNLPETLILSR